MQREGIVQAVQRLSSYDFGESASVLFEVDGLINESHGDQQARSWIEEELAAMLGKGVSLAAQQEICKRLWRVGTDASLDAVAELLAAEDPRVVAAGCYAIGRRPSSRADEILPTMLRRAPEPCRAPIENLIEDRR